MHATFALILVAGSAAQQPSDLPPFVKEYAPAMTFYYKNPDPTLGPKMLAAVLKKENIGHPFLAKNDHLQNIIGAQAGDIAAGDPKLVREYEAMLPGATTAGRRVVIRALMNCGDMDTAKQAAAWAADEKFADVKPELAALQKHLGDPKRKHARDLPARDPKDLDILWSNFFITGEYAPVSRILDVLDLPDAKENEVMKRVAKWSLGSNLQQHPKLAEVVRKNAKDRPEGSRKVIGELIVAPPKK